MGDMSGGGPLYKVCTLLKRVSWFNKPDCEYGPRGFFLRYELRMTTGCKKVQNRTQVLGSFVLVNNFGRIFKEKSIV